MAPNKKVEKAALPKSPADLYEMLHEPHINPGAAAATLSFLDQEMSLDIARGGRGDWTVVKCLDGSTALILKNIGKAFAFYGKEWDTKFKIVLNIFDKIKADATAEVKTKIVKLFDNLNYVNATIREMYQNSYLTFAGNPCKESSQREKQRMDKGIAILGTKLIAMKIILDAGGPKVIDKASDMLLTIIDHISKL